MAACPVVRDLVAGLDDGQRRAVLAPLGPVCVLAGAGTGKTRTITHRIAQLINAGQVAAEEVLAVTFTTRAAGEMRHRLRALGAPGVQSRTFHSAALRQLRYFWPTAIGGTMWPVLDNKMRLVAGAARRAGLDTDRASLRDIAGEIEWAKATLSAPEDYPRAAAAAQRDLPYPAASIASAFTAYEDAKSRSEQLDFDDLLLHICAILESEENIARQFRARYRCFVVDEYQDVTPLQQRVLTAWLGGRDNLTVVGDANQTIYSFAGASASYLLGFERTYPQAVLVTLSKDYRSTPQVVSLANQVIAPSSTQRRTKLVLTGMRPPGAAPTFTEYPDEAAEAAAVARQISELTAAGTPASAIAILYRINAQSEVYESALAAAGLPYLVRGSERYFERPEIRGAMAVLSRVEPGVGRGPELLAHLRRALGEVGLTETPPAGGAQRDRWDALGLLVNMAEEVLVTTPDTDLVGFAAELAERAAAQHAPQADGVTLASLHSAKGLEWDAVFLVGLSDGTLPIQHAVTDADIEEERRLLYVGLTRAKTRLHLSWALSRTAGGRGHRRRSRFLSGIAPEMPRVRSARRCRICHGVLRTPAEIKAVRCGKCPSHADPALVDALRSWRSQRASSDAVPAYVVFSDATLMAIAERQPVDDAGLLAISGIGPTKLQRYGEDVKKIVQQAR